MNVRITQKWDHLLERFPENTTDIYYTEGYSKLYENEKDTALCIVCEDEGRLAIMPYMMRSIGQYYDFETTYGYGGPIFNTDSGEWIEESLEAMKEHFKQAGYLCGFIRFHTLLDNAGLCKNKIKVMYDRKTIAIDLNDEIEEIWSYQITSKNRNMIRKAEKNGLEYRAEYDHASMDDFIRLYDQTMKRLNADEFYFFDNNYYKRYPDDMAGKGFLGTVRSDGKIIGAALFMCYGGFGHYHLAGSDREYSGLGINNYMLWNTAIEMKKQGLKLFHLGGGTSSDPEDTLYKFKRSFSRNEKDFYIGKWIFNTEAYENICAKWEHDHPELIPVYGSRLLKYRYTGI